MGWVNEAAFSKSYPAKRPLRHENSLLTTSRKEERKRLVPRFVEREFRAFLDCGNYGAALPSASPVNRVATTACWLSPANPECGAHRVAEVTRFQRRRTPDDTDRTVDANRTLER